jgi:hypothetical protein
MGVETCTKYHGGPTRITVADTLYQPPWFELNPRGIYKYFCNHARRLRIEKLLGLELSSSPNRFFKPLLEPGGGFTSETAARRTKRLQIYNGYI